MQEIETITAIERIVIVGLIVLNMNDVRGVSKCKFISPKAENKTIIINYLAP